MDKFIFSKDTETDFEIIDHFDTIYPKITEKFKVPEKSTLKMVSNFNIPVLVTQETINTDLKKFRDEIHRKNIQDMLERQIIKESIENDEIETFADINIPRGMKSRFSKKNNINYDQDKISSKLMGLKYTKQTFDSIVSNDTDLDQLAEIQSDRKFYNKYRQANRHLQKQISSVSKKYNNQERSREHTAKYTPFS